MQTPIEFEANAYFDVLNAASSFALAIAALAVGGYALYHDQIRIGVVPLGLGVVLLVGAVVGVLRRRVPTAYVRISETRIEWLYNGRTVAFDREGIFEIHYNDSSPASFTFRTADGQHRTCLSGLAPAQDHELYNFFARTFPGRLLHNGNDTRRVL